MTAAQQVAVINDDISQRAGWAELVRDAGYRPVPIDGRFNSVEEFAAVVKSKANLAVCDNRLSPKGMAQFPGVQLAAHLNKVWKLSTLLVTDYVNYDVESIRPFRQNVPILLRSADFQDPEVIRDAFRSCENEIIRNIIPSSRNPWRTLVHVVDVREDGKQKIAVAYVPAWNPYDAVSFPVESAGDIVGPTMKADSFYFARVNIGAERAEDLFFSKFEPAPYPD